MITSVQNSQIKRIRALKRRTVRDESDLLRIEGYREIDRALDADIQFEDVLFCSAMPRFKLSEQILQRIQEICSTTPVETSRHVFEAISQWQNPDGLLVVARKPPQSLAKLNPTSDFVCLVVEAIEKPGNLGSMFRTADATGCNAIVVADQVVDLYNPNVIRASLGTVFTVDSAVATEKELRDWLVGSELRIVCASPQATCSYLDVDLARNCAIVIGSEKDGLSAHWLEEASSIVKLPNEGFADSLNAAMAANALLFESYRQRKVAG